MPVNLNLVAVDIGERRVNKDERRANKDERRANERKDEQVAFNARLDETLTEAQADMPGTKYVASVRPRPQSPGSR